MADTARTRRDSALANTRSHDVFLWSVIVAVVLSALLGVVFVSYHNDQIHRRGEHISYDVEVAREMVEPTLERLHAGVITRDQAIGRIRHALAALSIQRDGDHRVIWLVDASGELLERPKSEGDETIQRMHAAVFQRVQDTRRASRMTPELVDADGEKILVHAVRLHELDAVLGAEVSLTREIRSMRRFFAQFGLVVLLSYLVLVLTLLHNLRAVRRQHARLIAETQEREHVEHELTRAHERFELAVRGSSLAFWSWDVTSDRLWVDERSRLVLDVNGSGTVPGGEMLDFVEAFVHAEDREALRDAMLEHITHREPFVHTMRVTFGERDVRFIQVRGQAVWNDDGVALRVGGTAADVTEQRGLEEQVRQAQRMESVGMLAGGIAHDFNNLLMVIRSYVEFIDEEFDEGHHVKEYLGEIRHAGERATELTRQLLAYSRQQVIESRPTDLDDLLGRIRGLLRRSIRENINLVLELRGGLPAVFVDPGQTEQVILNLCINARDAMPDGGELTIETREVELTEPRAGVADRIDPGRYVRMTVRDTGQGIPADILDKIFEPFFTTKDIGQGTGLGLSTVIGIVRQQRGGVEVWSEMGVGSTFHVYLPVAQQPARRVLTAELPSVGGSEVVLLAEDEDTVRALAVRVLTRAGYTVLAACDGLQALELFESRADDIDIAVLDVVMPRMSGPAAREKISERRPDLPVLYSTGYSAGELPPDELADASVSVLTKPYRPRLLTSRVRDMLDRAESSVELRAPEPEAPSPSPRPA